LTLNTHSSALHAKYGVALSKRAYYHQKQMFAIAGARGAVPSASLTKPGTTQLWTPRELYSLADSHFNKAVQLEPGESKNWVYWAKSLHVRNEIDSRSRAWP
jgi:hypothetical protein